jgi:DNA-binding NtrC family response regulator
MEMNPLVSKAVLSLDDDVEVCALLEQLLWPHRVIGVAHAYVALELLAREAFDLFILDVRLPDMNGLELCRRIRAVDPNAPIVFFSGAVSPEDIDQAMRAGASDYFFKPLDPERLHAGIEELLMFADERNHRAEAAARELLAEWAPGAPPAELQESGEPSLLRDAVYRRYLEAGGTRAHFLRAWPAMLEDAVVGAPLVEDAPPLLRRHGG